MTVKSSLLVSTRRAFLGTSAVLIAAPAIARAESMTLLGAGQAASPPVAPFIGSGDIKAGAFASWSVARAYSAAYAASGGPAMNLVDQAGANPITINVLATGKVDVASINAWVSAHSVTTIKVAQLFDQSGNGHHVSQATLANMPTLLLAHPGLGNNLSLPTMDFTGTQTLVSAATGLSSATGTFSYIARANILGLFSGSFGGVIQAGTFGPAFSSNNSGNGMTLFGGSVPTTPSLADNFHATQAVFNGASSFAVVDGLVNPAVNPGGGTLGSPFTIGQINNAFPLTGDISEIRFDASVWTTTDAANEYANQKAFWFSNPAYEGVVASRVRQRLSSDNTNLFANSRSAHIASQALTAIKVGFGNFANGSATITASVEFPAGTFTQLKFLGSTSVTLAGGAPRLECFTDYATVSIPAGSTFWIREFWNGSGGAAGTNYNTWQNSFLGEATAMSATALSDQTMSGTITNSGSPSGVSRPPASIIGVTTKATAVVVGDSIAAGTADVEDNSNTATGFNDVVGYLNRSLNAFGVPFANYAISGTQGANQAPLLSMGKCSHLITDFGINDFDIGGASAATLIASLSAFTQYAGPNVKVFQTTITPHTTSTDAWMTVANQSSNNPTTDTNRDLFNPALRAGTTGIARLAGFYDTASVVESGINSNKWTVTPTPPYTTDGLHPNVAGHALLVSSGIVSAPVFP
jgi:lysophospholipase L1-like esterase